MAIIALKAWYVKDYQPIAEIAKRAHDLRLSRNSLLKSGLRADFLDDNEQVKESEWFGRYLEGEAIEFYIEGSGIYSISNIDLISQEIYFTKREQMANLDPVIYFSHQNEYQQSSEAIQEALKESLSKLNLRSRLPLTLVIAQRSAESPLRISDNQLRQIRKSLLFVADTTAVATIDNRLIPSPNVCVEIGYAIETKKQGQILLTKMSRPDCTGKFPFDLPKTGELEFSDPQDLQETLLTSIEIHLQRFRLFS